MKYGDKVYYSSELDDEVVAFNDKHKKIDGKYKYVHTNPFYKFAEFFIYHIIAKPIVWCYLKFNHIKVVNRKLLKHCKKGGYFIYANHTSQITDAFHPITTCSPHKPFIICGAENLSLPFIGKLLPILGAVPLPDTLDATRNFNQKIEYVIKRNHPVLIYPEAHLWPYYTKIRPFNEKSFRYPVKYDKPMYTFTSTYQMRKPGKKPKLTIYIDGPFYPDKTLTEKEQRKRMRDVAFEKMCERSKVSNYEYLTYIKKEDNENQQQD